NTMVNDPLPHTRIGRGRIRPRAARSRFDRIQAPFPIPGKELVKVLSAHPVLGGRFRHSELLRDDLQDHDSVLRHRPRLSPMSRLMRRLSGVAYVVNSDTLGSTL